jgi:TatD DNase family protein
LVRCRSANRSIKIRPMFIDSHAHLDFPDFQDDIKPLLDRAAAAGIQRILTVGSEPGPGRLDAGIHVAERFAGIDASIGIHPHEAKSVTEEDFKALTGLASHPKVVAWGEIGLDYHYDHSPRATQREVFIRQLGLAREARLPVIVHTREAEEETLEILRDYWSGRSGVLHCFSGSAELAATCLEMGFLISFSGMVTFPKAEAIRQVVASVPLERLLIETDAPYLAPVPHRGRRNEPAFVVETAKMIAQLKGIGIDELGRITSENYCRLFGIGWEQLTAEVRPG